VLPTLRSGLEASRSRLLCCGNDLTVATVFAARGTVASVLPAVKAHEGDNQ